MRLLIDRCYITAIACSKVTGPTQVSFVDCIVGNAAGDVENSGECGDEKQMALIPGKRCSQWHASVLLCVKEHVELFG